MYMRSPVLRDTTILAKYPYSKLRIYGMNDRDINITQKYSRLCFVALGGAVRRTLGLGNELRNALHADLKLMPFITPAQMLWHSSARPTVATESSTLVASPSEGFMTLELCTKKRERGKGVSHDRDKSMIHKFRVFISAVLGLSKMKPSRGAEHL